MNYDEHFAKVINILSQFSNIAEALKIKNDELYDTVKEQAARLSLLENRVAILDSKYDSLHDPRKMLD